MRIHVSFTDRVGITQEVLAILGGRNLNLEAVEMAPPNVYIDAPALDADVLEELQATLLSVPGVRAVDWVDFLPGDRRRLQLDTLLEVMGDPMIAVDAQGCIMLANVAFCRLMGVQTTPQGSLADLIGDSQSVEQLIAKGFKLGMTEIMVKGSGYLMESTPVGQENGNGLIAGALITFFPPRRIGERLAALQEDHGLEAILGSSVAVDALKIRVRKLAVLDAPLLIQGETGTGKELVARACHSISDRCDRPFLALNCAALPESLAESELFGYSAGAFTGAQRGGKPGLLELSDGGTVFLDEIGEMSPYLQAKLLRFLNDGTFRRVGGDKELKVNVRILSATHRDLEALVNQGSFREDLLYRLNVLNVNVPPLRDRGEDILLLATHFLRMACAQIREKTLRLAKDAQDALLCNAWPGNVRQLQNVIFRTAAMTETNSINAANLELAGTALLPPSSPEVAQVDSLEEAVQAFESNLLAQLYPEYPTTRLLAERLKTSHTAIGQRLRKYGLPKRNN